MQEECVSHNKRELRAQRKHGERVWAVITSENCLRRRQQEISVSLVREFLRSVKENILSMRHMWDLCTCGTSTVVCTP